VINIRSYTLTFAIFSFLTAGDGAGSVLNAACMFRGTGQAGDACQYATDCVAGTMCQNGTSGAICMQMCDTTHPCDGERDCKRLDGTAPGVSVGVCE